MTKVIIKDGLEYTASNSRLRYNPEFHDNQKQPWTEDDLAYMCSVWEGMKKADISMALGRTHNTVLNKAHELRKNGKFEYYKKLGKEL